MARQLVEQRRSLLHHVNEYLDAGTSKQLPGVNIQKEGDRLHSLTANLSKSFTKVYLILDGLDEFSAQLERRRELLSRLARLRAGLSNSTILRLCISSRIDQEAQGSLGSHTSVTIRPDSSSIRSFIIDRLQQSPTLRRMAKNTDLYHQIIDSVESRSDRM